MARLERQRPGAPIRRFVEIAGLEVEAGKADHRIDVAGHALERLAQHRDGLLAVAIGLCRALPRC